MRFDDRLQTMLDAAVADPRDRAVRWRQLVDLLSRVAPSEQSASVQAALDLVRLEAFAIDEAVRAATLRAIAGRPVPSALLAILAAQPVRIAAPLFAGLTLSPADALVILATADDDVRALVRVEPAPIADMPAAAETASTPSSPLPINEMVERIERLTVDRAPRGDSEPPPGASPGADAAPIPVARANATRPLRPSSASPRRQAAAVGEGRLFEWESDASGHIAWVEGVPRGALVGRPLGGEGVGLLERQAASRLGQRHPFIDVPLALGPSSPGPLALGEAIPGMWSATGVPAFDPATGRFLGYRGLARRTDGDARGSGFGGEDGREPDTDALRELVHEIKTPLNAIIGFAEIIDGQYLGPAHARYRERAASIVGQARHLLEAVEDLDFAARLRADRARGHHDGGRFVELFVPLAAEIDTCLAANGGALELDIDDDRHRCALSPELAARLLRRLLLSLCKSVGAGETFRIAVTRRGAMSLLTVARPRLLDGVSEAQMIDPAYDPTGTKADGGAETNGRETDGRETGGVGLGFALRLVRGLAKVAGGSLAIDEHRITLILPALDG